MKKRKEIKTTRLLVRMDSEEKARLFLDAYSKCGLIKQAADHLGISHGNHYHWMIRLPWYPKAFRRVIRKLRKRVGELATAELYDRAIHGTESLVIFEGSPVTVWVNAEGAHVPAPKDPLSPPEGWTQVLYKEVQKHDGLLKLLLQSCYPELFADASKVEVRGNVKHSVESEQVKKILADPQATELANSLARRLAIHAGGNGQSAN